MKTAKAFAPAKINLTLHVTGQRADGYHLLDSLVVFGDIGDRITVSPADRLRLSVSGPMAKGVPTDASNLVLRAADLMGLTADIRLEKHLPAAAGLGGGSADAAAAIWALSEMTGRPPPEVPDLLKLGADIPLCMMGNATRMRGIGERLETVDIPQNLSMILVNPGIAVATGPVFQRLEHNNQAPMGDMPTGQNMADWLRWVADQRNDLQSPAISVEPVIGQVLEALQQSDGCVLARMSGSGATCFAIMRDGDCRDRAVENLSQAFPGWWVKPCNTGRLRPS
jgi:4-diphosphocytidyl-2-C-methyl-D-erythritol kinase